MYMQLHTHDRAVSVTPSRKIRAEPDPTSGSRYLRLRFPQSQEPGSQAWISLSGAGGRLADGDGVDEEAAFGKREDEGRVETRPPEGQAGDRGRDDPPAAE
jgi:hypothetical protein